MENVKFYSSKSNAKRAAVKAGVDIETATLQERDGQFAYVQEVLFTADTLAQAEATANALQAEAEAAEVVRQEELRLEERRQEERRSTEAAQQQLPTVPKEEDVILARLHAGHCPHCDAGQSTQTWANKAETTCFCHRCNVTYSATTGRKVNAGYTRPDAPSGYHITKERETRNGVTRRSPGTLCDNIWVALDQFQAEHGCVTSKDLDPITQAGGWNRGNVQCEYYAWRKFNGISGRVTRTATAQ